MAGGRGPPAAQRAVAANSPHVAVPCGADLLLEISERGRRRLSSTCMESHRRNLHLDFVAQQGSPAVNQTLLTLLCAYPNSTLNSQTAGEDYWRVSTFAASGSVHAAFRDSSYGKVSFREAGSKFVVATMNHVAPADGSCQTSTERSSCLAAAQAADSTLTTAAISQYDHVEYWMPNECACGWAGWGVSCMYLSTLGNTPRGRGSNCWSVTFASSGGSLTSRLDTRIHELGHNMGISHAGGYENEYGDPVRADSKSNVARACTSVAARTGSPERALCAPHACAPMRRRA